MHTLKTISQHTAICLAIALLLTPNVLLAQKHLLSPKSDVQLLIDRAKPHDTLVFSPGTYQVYQIVIRKPLTLIGENRPILDAQLNGDILIIAADSVHITGFELRNTGTANVDDPAAIKVFDSKNCSFTNNILINTFFGIHISNSRGIVIRNNHLVSVAEREYHAGNGIHLWKSRNNTIENNYIKGHRDGIYLEFTTNTVSKDNIVEDNMRYGLHFMFSHDNSYLHNTFRRNGAGVAVMYTRGVIMKYNIFTENQGPSSYGLLLKDISDSEVRYNMFSKNTIGIYMEGTSRTVFDLNEFRENGSALKLMASCDDNTFTKNNFVGNTFDITTNGSLVLNTLTNNYWDKYEGYDLDRDGFGDVPYRPISLYGTIIERIPASVVLWRSFLVTLLDRSEKVLPAITPENMKDESPSMNTHDIYRKIK